MTEEEHNMVQFYLDEITDGMESSDFQAEFFESLKSQYETRNSLSVKQIACLKRMYDRVTG